MLIAILFSIYMYAFNSPALYHDIHVSVCDIELKEAKSELLLKTFLDDLQLAIGLVPGEELPADYTSANELIDEYIQQSIRISFGGRDVRLELEDISTSGLEAVWITYKIDSSLSDQKKDLEIKNSLLTEVYSDQTNLINIYYGDNRKTFTMNRKKRLVKHTLN